MFKFRDLVAVCFVFWTNTSAVADEFPQNLDELESLLTNTLGDGTLVHHNVSVGDSDSQHRRFGGCDSTTKHVPPGHVNFGWDLVKYLFVAYGMANYSVEVSEVYPFGGCIFTITGFDEAKLQEFNLQTQINDQGKEYVRVPLSKQDFIGVSKYWRKGPSETSDLCFEPWFRNYEHSKFVSRFREYFEDGSYNYEGIYSDRDKTDPWCIGRTPEGGIEWKTWTRY